MLLTCESEKLEAKKELRMDIKRKEEENKE
jgi:hypothetical protein